MNFARNVSTIGEIHSHDIITSPHDVMQGVANEFEKQADLPGVLIVEDCKLLGMIPRRKFYEMLSKPYGPELFLKRPVIEFYKTIDMPIIILPAAASIEEAVRNALERPIDHLYDPIIVSHTDGKLRLLDMQLLLRCQSQRLEHANRVIRSQVETGALLSNASRLEDVLEIILDAAYQSVEYQQGFIVIFSNGRWELGLARSEHEVHTPDDIQQMIHHQSEVIGLIGADSPIVVTSTNAMYAASISHNLFKKDHSFIVYPLAQAGKVLAVLVLGRNIDTTDLEDRSGNREPFQPGDLEFLNTLSNLAGAAIQNASLRQTLEHMAMTDNLTRLHNRHGFYEAARRLHSRSIEYQRPLSALMVDIDHFKKFNDHYGHFIGDQVLTRVAECLRAGLRGSDLLGRFGGEEFVVLLPDTPLSDSLQVALRLNEAVAEIHQHYGQSSQMKITISVGAAGIHLEPITLDELLERADQSLYAAKRHGRNCVAVEKEGQIEIVSSQRRQIPLY